MRLDPVSKFVCSARIGLKRFGSRKGSRDVKVIFSIFDIKQTISGKTNFALKTVVNHGGGQPLSILGGSPRVPMEEYVARGGVIHIGVVVRRRIGQVSLDVLGPRLFGGSQRDKLGLLVGLEQ